MLKKYSGIKKREGFLLLFYLRIIDTIIILLFLITVILLLSCGVVQLKDISYITVFLLLLFAFIALLNGDKVLLAINNLAKKENCCGFFKKISNFTGELLPVYRFYKNKIKEAVVLSVLIFIILTFVLGFVLKAYPIDLSCVDIIVTSLIIIIIMSLPINSMAGIGTLEFGMAAFLASTGIDKDLSISVAFNYHFIYLMFIIFFGSLSYLYLNYKRNI